MDFKQISNSMQSMSYTYRCGEISTQNSYKKLVSQLQLSKTHVTNQMKIERKQGNPENNFTHSLNFLYTRVGRLNGFLFFLSFFFFFFKILNYLYKKGCCFLILLVLKHLLLLSVDLTGQKKEGILQACLKFAILSQAAILIHSKRNTSSGEWKEPVLICQDLCLFEKQQLSLHIIKISNSM